LRRQATTSRLAPAGSSRDERLDPFALPLRFEPAKPAADEHLRQVELHRERVVLRRDLRGIKMAVNQPLASNLGVSIRIEPPTDEQAGAIIVVLEHSDQQLSLILHRAPDASDIVAEWQSWGRALALPLLVIDADGRLRDAFRRIGPVRVGTPAARRRRHCGAAPASCRQRPSCIAASARSSPAIERQVSRPISYPAVRHGRRSGTRP
jgi:hypothetical protein